ncbi:hypothetical protein INR49_030389 [Caranx melampygus]|nr:hypothetical protein INR49_030389 [Caranx melampygus]
MSRYTTNSTRPSQVIEDSKKKTSLLKDNSWIRKADDEDEYVDRDPNYGKSILSQYRSSENLQSSDGDEVKTTTTTKSTPTSVQALTKRFSGNQGDLKSSQTTTSYTRSYSSVKSPSTTTTSTVTKDGKTTTETITTTQSVRSPVTKSPTKTETFTERVKSTSQGTLYSNLSPSKTTKVTETVTIKGGEDKVKETTETVVVDSSSSEDKLYDTLIPSSIKYGTSDSKTTVTETVTVKSSSNGPEDDLYDTLLPKAITSPVREDNPSLTVTSPTYTVRNSSYSVHGDDAPSIRSTYSVSTKPTYEYTSVTSPTTYTSTSYRSGSRSDDLLSINTPSTVKSVYTERLVHEKDLCTYCRKPFIGEAKMILDDMKINCHATCFKCEVCNCTLGHLKAGDSMWVYKRMVHCENCFEVTRDKWRR